MIPERARQKLHEGKGVTTKEKGVYIPHSQRLPYAPEYAHMSKKDVVEAEKRRRERNLKLKEYENQLKAGEQKSEVKPEPKSEPEKKPEVQQQAQPEKKKRGRKKKAE